VGGYEARTPVRVELPLEYHPANVGFLTSVRNPDQGQRLVGSLTGAVASQRVTEALKGSLRPVGNRSSSVRAQGSLTARLTGQAGAKAGPSDPAAISGNAVAQRLKGTPGITGLSSPRVHIDGKVWHLNYWGGAAEMPLKHRLITVNP
jgi:hypothetical protein